MSKFCDPTFLISPLSEKKVISEVGSLTGYDKVICTSEESLQNQLTSNNSTAEMF